MGRTGLGLIGMLLLVVTVILVVIASTPGGLATVLASFGSRSRAASMSQVQPGPHVMTAPEASGKVRQFRQDMRAMDSLASSVRTMP